MKQKIKCFALICMLILFYSFVKAQLITPFEPTTYFKNPTNFKEKSYNFFMSNRLKQATKQRDSMFVLFTNLRTIFGRDSVKRNGIIDSLTKDFNELNDKYIKLTKAYNRNKDDYDLINKKFSEFMESSTSNADKLSIALAQKNKDLEQKNNDLLDRENRLKELEAISKKQDSISKALRALIQKALLNFNNKELTVELKNGKVYISFSDEFLFKSGSADVESKGLDALKKVADVINQNEKIDILIEGHTDNVPIKSAKLKDNWDLSAARAISVVRLLSNSYDVIPAKLTAAGRGEFANKASNETAEGRAKNRRIEIILTPDLSALYNMIYQ